MLKIGHENDTGNQQIKLKQYNENDSGRETNKEWYVRNIQNSIYIFVYTQLRIDGSWVCLLVVAFGIL